MSTGSHAPVFEAPRGSEFRDLGAGLNRDGGRTEEPSGRRGKRVGLLNRRFVEGISEDRPRKSDSPSPGTLRSSSGGVRSRVSRKIGFESPVAPDKVPSEALRTAFGRPNRPEKIFSHRFFLQTEQKESFRGTRSSKRCKRNLIAAFVAPIIPERSFPSHSDVKFRRNCVFRLIQGIDWHHLTMCRYLCRSCFRTGAIECALSPVLRGHSATRTVRPQLLREGCESVRSRFAGPAPVTPPTSVAPSASAVPSMESPSSPASVNFDESERSPRVFASSVF